MIAQTRTGHTLLRVDEVGELNGIANEEDRSVVAYQVVVAFGGVEFHRETAWVTPGIGEPDSPATVEKRISSSVLTPG